MRQRPSGSSRRYSIPRRESLWPLELSAREYHWYSQWPISQVTQTNLDNFQLYKRIRNYLLARTADVMTYESWSIDFAVKHIRTLPADIKKGTYYNPIDLESLTKNQATELGFVDWSDDSELMLIPSWLYSFLPPTVKVTTISDKEYEGPSSELDNDSRSGALAYGIFPRSDVNA